MSAVVFSQSVFEFEEQGNGLFDEVIEIANTEDVALESVARDYDQCGLSQYIFVNTFNP